MSGHGALCTAASCDEARRDSRPPPPNHTSQGGATVTEQVQREILGDLSAAYLQAKVIDSGDEPVLEIDDGEFAVNIDPAYGSVERAILGMQRLITVAQEYVDLLKQSAYRRTG